MKSEKKKMTASYRGGDGYSEAELLYVLKWLATSVDTLHKKYQVFHCDIKPDNIVLVPSKYQMYKLQLIDFGTSDAALPLPLTLLSPRWFRGEMSRLPRMLHASLYGQSHVNDA